MVKVKEDMTGWIMSEHGVPDSRLIVIEQVEDYVDASERRRAQYMCECSCKSRNTVVARADHIKCGKIKSCGCIHKEYASKRGKLNKLYNNYDLTHDYGIGWTTNTNKKFYFDLEDYDKIKNYTWRENTNGYATTTINYKQVTMHVFLGYKWHDHKDRNRLNNRRINLRPCTVSENNQNRSKTDANTSGFIGVCFDKDRNKWMSYIKVNGKHISLGRFADQIEAVVARLKAENKYFKEFAPQKHLFKEYGICIEGDGCV